MCGIAGIVDPVGKVELRATAATMAARLAHRGPDDSAVWLDHNARVALAHRRLAVIDLSASGRQPMTASDGRYTVTYDGELYNYRELKSALAAVDPTLAWRSTCDTEVLLEAISVWGIG